MIEPNPHRRLARVVAFVCYVVAVAVLLIGAVCTLAAATIDMREIRGVEGMTNARMTAMVGSMFAIWTVMIALLGWRIQRVFGQHRRMEKPIARAAVVSLRLGGLGCGLWA